MELQHPTNTSAKFCLTQQILSFPLTPSSLPLSMACHENLDHFQGLIIVSWCEDTMCGCTTGGAVVHRRKGESHGDLTSMMGRKEHLLVWPLSWRGVDPAWPRLLSSSNQHCCRPLPAPAPASHPCSTIPGLRPGKAALAQADWVLVKLLPGAFFGLNYHWRVLG